MWITGVYSLVSLSVKWKGAPAPFEGLLKKGRDPSSCACFPPMFSICALHCIYRCHSRCQALSAGAVKVLGSHLRSDPSNTSSLSAGSWHVSLLPTCFLLSWDGTADVILSPAHLLLVGSGACPCHAFLGSYQPHLVRL